VGWYMETNNVVRRVRSQRERERERERERDTTLLLLCTDSNLIHTALSTTQHYTATNNQPEGCTLIGSQLSAWSSSPSSASSKSDTLEDTVDIVSGIERGQREIRTEAHTARACPVYGEVREGREKQQP
jgi:hypothetical protein